MSEFTIRTLQPGDHRNAMRLLAHLNPDCSGDTLRARFQTILDDHPHYIPVGGFLEEEMIAFAGAWIATRIWCGRYLEIDNFVVHPAHRSGGFGSRLMDHLEALAVERDCNLVTLDSYTQNHASHRLYHRRGYEIWGFHFIKPLGGFEH